MKQYFKYIYLSIGVICLGGLVVAFYFLYTNIHTSGERTQQILSEIQNEQKRREEIKLINKSIDTIKQDRDILNTHFAQNSDIVPFLNTIESLAPKVGAKAETSSVDVLKDGAGLVVKLNVEGTFNSVYKFLMLMENSPYELDISNLVMQRKPDTAVTPEGVPIVSKEPVWQAVFTVNLLSFIK